MLRANLWTGRRLLNLDAGISPQLMDRGDEHLDTSVPAPRTGGHSIETTASSQRCGLRSVHFGIGMGCGTQRKPISWRSLQAATTHPLRQVRQIKPSESRKPRRAASHRQQERTVWSTERWFPEELRAHKESWETAQEEIP